MALPMSQQILPDVISPPILAALWWSFSRGWANTVQGGEVSQRTKLRQKRGFWIVLIGLYLLMFGATVYFNFAA